MFFFDSGGRISKREFDRACYHLRFDHGFSSEQIIRLEEIFRGDLYESGDATGISREELKKGIAWLKTNTDKHHFSAHQIERIESTLKKYL